MTLPTPIPDPLVELIARRFRLLAEPMRIRVLDGLRRAEETCVGGLARDLGSTQQNISKHLNVLYDAGVLARRKEGNRVLYRIADPELLALCEHVCGGLAQRAAELDELLEESVSK